MKNKKYRLALPVYDFVRSEERYRQMAAEGWLLEKRGGFLERYRRGEPQERQYRMEFRPVKAFEGVEQMTEEELAVYADCGWELVSASGNGGICVFSASGEVRDTELYTDRQGRTAFVKRSRNYVGGVGLCWLGFWVGRFLLPAAFGGKTLFGPRGLFGGDWLFLLLTALALYVTWAAIYGGYRCGRLVRLAKRGRSLRSPETQRKHLAGRIIRGILGGAVLLCAAGSLYLLCTVRKAPLPEPGSREPYVLLGEVFSGQRAAENLLGQPADNDVQAMHGLLSDNYTAEECFTTDKGEDLWLDQACYVLKWGGGPAEALARDLLSATAFADWDEMETREVPGFDGVFACPYAIAAVKGNRVACFTGSADELNENWDKVLEVLLEKWESADN